MEAPRLWAAAFENTLSTTTPAMISDMPQEKGACHQKRATWQLAQIWWLVLAPLRRRRHVVAASFSMSV